MLQWEREARAKIMLWDFIIKLVNVSYYRSETTDLIQNEKCPDSIVYWSIDIYIYITHDYILQKLADQVL